MAVGYLIAILCCAVGLLVTALRRERNIRQPKLRVEAYQRMKELLESGQVFRGTVRLKEGLGEAVYTVKLSFAQGRYEYAMFKNGEAFELISEADFRDLIQEVKLGGILQLEELDLPF